jgi:hypothetical protein
MVFRAEVALTVLWDLAIPLVPASLLVSPAIWRNVCPLATLNLLGNRRTGGRRLGPPITHRLWAVGIVLLVVLVPARRLVFNTNGAALAATVVLVALAAVVLGRFFDMKAGFCNTLCPVLPVERLYGQAPLLTVGNPRCAACSLCTPIACLDLNPTKSPSQVLGQRRQAVVGAGGSPPSGRLPPAPTSSSRWLLTGFGVFAASFPGFVVGYNTTQDGALSTAGTVYGQVLAWMIGSYLVTATVVLALRLTAGRALLALGATAATLYYWFGSRTIAEALHLGEAGTTSLRVVFFGLIAVWLARAVTGRRPEGGRVSGGMRGATGSGGAVGGLGPDIKSAR